MILLLALVLLAYAYIGYPLLLRLLVSLRGTRRVAQADIRPSVSLVISAFNEADVIRGKLANAVALDYPRDLLEVVLISDASDDGTDEIVREFAMQGVQLARQEVRRGKTAGLNNTVPRLRGDIVVFSDANALYEPDAIAKLVRNFADASVGCVTGEARYRAGGTSTADVGERAYWDYEIQIKRYETALGSMVGGDGAIYAIRRSLWRTLPEDAINDFLNPLQIVESGFRSVYEPEAVCYEDTAGRMKVEFRRRVRIVSRSWRAVFQASGVFNPFRVGLFTWSLVSHKVLRWLSGVFIVLAAFGAVDLLAEAYGRRPGVVVGLTLIAAALLTLTRHGRHLAAMATYFMVVNAASTLGIAKGSIGRVSGVWATPREQQGRQAPDIGPIVPVGRVVRWFALALVVTIPLFARSMTVQQFAMLLFWTSCAIIVWVYVGYPLFLAALKRIAGRPVRRRPIEPTVCVFIAANDEASVIASKLRNTLALSYPPDRLEIVVASDGSVDDTNDIVRRFAPRVRLLEFSPRRGKMATINEGIKSIGADIVVFSDANTFLDSDAVRALVGNFADPEVGAVSGDVVLVGERAALGQSEDLYYRYERWIQQAESDIGSMIGADGALYAIRRELFAAPRADTILDDMAIPMGVIRAGRRVVFEGGARAYEQGSETAQEEFSRKTRVVAGAMQFISRHDSDVPVSMPQVILSLVSHKALRWLSPFFATMAFFSSLVLAAVSIGYAIAVGGQTALVVIGLAGCAPSLRQIGFVALAHYFCLVQAAAAVGFLLGLTGRQSVLWRRFNRMPMESF